MVIWQPRWGGWQGWWRPWSHQDCSRFLLHRLHSPGSMNDCAPGAWNVVTISPVVTRQPIMAQISLFIWDRSSGQTAVTIRITLVTLRTRILPWHNMDITITVLLLIWLTSKWLSSGLFILLAGHTRPGLSAPVSMCGDVSGQWEAWVLTHPDQGPWGPHRPHSSPSLSGMMQTLTQLC